MIFVLALPRCQVLAVEAGQVYRHRPRRKGARVRHLRVLRVLRSSNRPPVASLIEVTSGGTVKRGGRSVLSVCTWRDEAWRLRSGYELVERDRGAA